MKKLYTEKFTKILGSYSPELFLQINAVNIENDDLIQSKFRFSSTSLHEDLHWFQFSATTWGFLYNIFIHSQTEQVINYSFISELKTLIDNFNAINLDENFHIIQKKGQNENEEFFKEVWNNFLISQNLLQDKIDFNEISFERCNIAIGDVLLHFLLYCSENYHGKVITQYDKYSKNLKIDHNTFHYEKNRKLRLEHLLESQARLNDTIYMLLNLSKGCNASDLQIFNNDTYWTAFYEYLRIIKIKIEVIKPNELHFEFLKLLGIIDISLNIPIISIIDINDSINWIDFSPVERFYSICSFLSESRYSKKINNASDYNDYINTICQKMNWLSPQKIALLIIKNVPKKILDFESAWSDNDKDITKFNFIDYIYYLQYKNSQLRSKGYVYSSANCLYWVGEDAGKTLEFKMLENRVWFSPPFHLREGSHKLKTVLEDVQYSWLLQHVLYSYIIRRFLFNKLPITRTSFPFFVSEGFKKSVINTFIHNFNINLKQRWKM